MKVYKVTIKYIQDGEDWKKTKLEQYAKNSTELNNIIQHFESDKYQVKVKTFFI